MIMASRKRKCITLEVKKMLIDEVEEGTRSKAKICEAYGIPSSTLFTILKNKDVIKEAVVSGDFLSCRRKRRTPQYVAIDNALYKWYSVVKNLNIDVTGTILRKKGEQIAKELGLDDFRLNCGWLGRFKKRHGISFVKNATTHTDVTEQSTFEEFADEDNVSEAATSQQNKAELQNIKKEILAFAESEILKSSDSADEHSEADYVPSEESSLENNSHRTSYKYKSTNANKKIRELASGSSSFSHGGVDSPHAQDVSLQLETEDKVPPLTTDLCTATQTIEYLHDFLQRQPDSASALAHLDAVKDFVKSLIKQPRIDSFFQRFSK